ncbi:MAG: hypothetical protein WA793_12670, partial [Sphingorhabdus sp.]|uniref:hypothetical protein n=1 Tax=Sphingorhabdus sp. TaxID=1902408 RepID=UPI003C9B9E6D
QASGQFRAASIGIRSYDGEGYRVGAAVRIFIAGDGSIDNRAPSQSRYRYGAIKKRQLQTK